MGHSIIEISYSIMIFIKSIIFFIFDSFCLLFIKKQTTHQIVLLIRQDAIGDFVLWLDTAKGYRKLYPPENYKIVLVGNALWCDLAKELPFWDEVLPVNVKAFKTLSGYRWNILRIVRNFGAKIAIQPTFSREFYHGDTLIRASNASRKISSIGDMSNRNGLKTFLADSWHTELIPASPEPLSEMMRNSEFFSGLTGGTHHVKFPELNVPKTWLPPKHRDQLFYVLVPGAGTSRKKWAPDFFAKLAEKIYQRSGWNGLIFGAQQELFLGEQIQKQSDAPLLNLVGKTELTELSGLLSLSQLIISNDTGAVHIASAVGTPTVCILGGGHFGRFVPYPELAGQTNYLKVVFHKMPCYGCNWECVYHIKKGEPAPCISNISVDAVWNEVKSLLFH